MQKNNDLGFTLLELMITVAIAGIIATMAVPSFQRMLERNRLKEAVESLKSDLMFARTEAIKRSTNLNVSIIVDGDDWCYGIDDDNTACDCDTSGSCALKTVDGDEFTGTIADASKNVAFNFRHGYLIDQDQEEEDEDIEITLSTTNYSAKTTISIAGRITICSPDSSKAMGGYDAC